jgi:hypothetical protein
MAVFISASDENTATDKREFSFGGFIAPEEDWSRYFAPAWQERVLNGPPPIPYLHMTEIRSRKFRDQHGLSRDDADSRLDEAVRVIEQLGSLRAVLIDINAEHFRGEMSDTKFIASTGGIKDYHHPDYFCFQAYVFAVLMYVEKWHPDTEKVNFIVERNGEITKHIQSFHSNMAIVLQQRGKGSLARRVGELIPDGKDRIPLQAADVLCWHMGRARNPDTMDNNDIRRHNSLAGINGMRVPLEESVVSAIKAAYRKYDNAPKDGG